MRLKTYAESPPGGYTITYPTSRHRCGGITFLELVKSVRQHEQNNNYTPLSAAEIEDILCGRLSNEDQQRHCDTGIHGDRAVKWQDAVADIARVGAAWAATGFETVAPEEAERRAQVCKTCIFNVGLSRGCAACKLAVDAAREQLLQATTSQDANLKNCGVCHCSLPLIVHVPLDVLRASGREHKFPKWCWQKAKEESAPP